MKKESFGIYFCFMIPDKNYIGFIIALVISYCMIAITFIDIKEMIIPDEITLPGIILGIIISAFYFDFHNRVISSGIFDFARFYFLKGILASLSGVLVGGGFLYIIGFLGTRVFKKEAMGGGDVKLMAMMGAFLGFPSVFLIIFMASLLGTVCVLPFVFSKKKELRAHIPFGPFLAIASVIVMCFGEKLLRYFLGL